MQVCLSRVSLKYSGVELIQAEVGEPVHLGAVDEVLRGVALPAGRHRIVMTYAPRSLPLAILVSLMTAAFLGWRLLPARARR